MAILRSRTVWRRDPAPRSHSEIKLPRHEQANVLRLIEALRLRLRTRRALATAMRTTPEALRKATNGRRPPTMRLAVMAAYAADMDVDAVLRGEPMPGPCPCCGRG